MTNRIVFLLLVPLATILVSFSQPRAATVDVEVVHSRDRYAAGEVYPVAFRLSVKEPWYIHGNEAGEEGIIPTVMQFERSPGAAIESVRWPVPGKMKFDYGPGSVEVFSKEVLVPASLRVMKGDPAGDRVIRGKLRYQACSPTACLPPEEVAFTVHVTVAPPGTDGKAVNSEVFNAIPRSGPEAAFWFTLIGLFAGGLALNLTPCIYPLIPITVSYFTGRAQRGSGGAVLHASLYMLGLATTNAALGLFAALSGGILGAALQSPWVLMLVSLVLILLATSFFGFWEIRLPPSLTRLAARNFGGILGSLFMGLTLGIVAAPCIGPFILGLLTYVGQKGDPFLGFLYFFVLSLGIGLPLAVLALFSGAVRKLPLSGDWMLWVRKGMGWVLVGMAAYIAGPIIPSHTGQTALLSGVILAAALHLGWLDRTGMQHRNFRLFKRVIGAVLAVSAAVLMIHSAAGREGIRWSPYDDGLLSKAAAEGKPVMIDFYADWCGPCKAMERGVFREPEVVETSLRYATLRVDLTTRGQGEDELLSRYKIRGVPTVVFLDRAGNERRELRIESVVGREELLQRMRRGLQNR
jgi:thiol:disulfide interchange protein DsbD